MSTSFGPRGFGAIHSGRLRLRDGADTVDLRHGGYRPSTTSARGRGQLGLDGGHREVADLIRRSEMLTASGDEDALHDAAQQVVQRLRRHLDDEGPLLETVDARQRARLIAGQEVLLERATRFATDPAADTGADLLALLVRQADMEEAAVHSHEEPTEKRSVSQFTTDWAISPVQAGSP